MNDPLLTANPKANYLAHKEEIDQAVLRVLESGWYILGEDLAAFEAEFASWLGLHHAFGVANGTDALEIALRAGGVGPGDAVFTVSNTAVATVAAIERTGALPLFVDIDPLTFTMDPASLEAAIRMVETSSDLAGKIRVKAVIPVHLYGHPADMPAIMSIAERHGLLVVEDCAQAHGAALHGRPVGTWGHISAFSCYPTKNLGALGDAGIVATSDSALAERVKLLRQYGWEERYISKIPGINSRLDPVQAAVLRVKLRYLDQENRRRQEVAGMYAAAFKDLDLILPHISHGASHVFHQYTLRSQERDELLSFLHQAGILAQVLYPTPIHLQPAYQGRIPLVVTLDWTEKVMQEIISIPIYPELSADQIQLILDRMVAWMLERRPA